MNFKRIAALLMALVLSLTLLASCGKDVQEDLGNPSGTIDPAVTANLPTDTEPTSESTQPSTEPTSSETEPPTSATEPPTSATEPPTSATEPSSESTKKTDKNDYTVEKMSGTMYTTISLNVRSGPSTDFKRIGALAQGDAVVITGRASTGWYEIDFKGEKGYVSNVYLTSEKPSGTNEKPSEVSPDDGTEHLDDEPSQDNNPPSTNPSTTTPSVSAGSWVKENGAEYMYSLFTEERYQQALNIIAEAVASMRPTADLTGYVTHDEAMDISQYIAQIVGTKYCYFNQVESVSGAVLTLNYFVSDSSKAAKMVSELEKVGDKIVSKISGYSDYNKIKYIYEYVAKNSSYGHGDYYASAYGPLCDGNGTCVGYAKAGFYLLSRAGFDAVYVCGNGQNDDHMWVKVKYDGKWYNVDFGWGDYVDESYGNVVRYDFLLVSDKYMRDTRNAVYDLSKYYKMPSASSDSMNWYSINDCYISKYSNTESVLKSATKTAIDKANGAEFVYVAVQFDTMDMMWDAVDDFTKAYFNSNILPGISSKYTAVYRVMDNHRNADDTAKVKKTRTLMFILQKK